MKTLSLNNEKSSFLPSLNNISRQTIYKMLNQLDDCQITLTESNDSKVFGDNHHKLHGVIHINDPIAYKFMISDGSIGAGEAFIQGFWSSPDVTKVIQCFSRNLHKLDAIEKYKNPLKSIGHWMYQMANKNTLSGSRKNISAHYDLGNEFFKCFLDPSMMYSSAVFPTPDSTLEEASYNKLKTICDQLQLKDSDHLVEIGTGWGSMAIYAAKNYGCQVTSTTISEEQYKYAKEQVELHNLEGKITLLKDDYRDLTGQYDKLVSIEMIEAVGHQFLDNFIEKCSSLLKPNGLMVMQAITIADQRYDDYHKSTDFIQRYIFPGGCLPTVDRISGMAKKHTDLQIVGLKDITPHYAETLRHWRNRFFSAADAISAQGFNDQFLKLWEYYLCYCEGGFRERVISTVQLSMAKPGHRF